MKKTIFALAFMGYQLMLTAQVDCSTGRYFTSLFSNTTEAAPVVYGNNKNWSTGLNQDLHITKISPVGDASITRPAILLFNGLNGSPNDVKSTCIAFAKRGWVAFAVEYRADGWSSEFIAPGASGDYERQYREWQDALAAVRYVRSIAGTAGIEANHIYIGGFSRGAMVSIQAGLLVDENNWDWNSAVLTANYGNKKASSPVALQNTSDAVAGILSFYGRLVYDNIGNYYSSINHLPFAGLHCQDDAVVPIDCSPSVGCGSRAIYNQFKNNGIEAYGYFPATGGHGHTPAMLDSAYLYMAKMLHCAAPNTIDETAAAQHIAVFPNPTNSQLMINADAIHTIELIDITGKTILQIEGNQQASQTIAIDNLSPALYWVVVNKQHPIKILKTNE